MAWGVGDRCPKAKHSCLHLLPRAGFGFYMWQVWTRLWPAFQGSAEWRRLLKSPADIQTFGSNFTETKMKTGSVCQYSQPQSCQGLREGQLPSLPAKDEETEEWGWGWWRRWGWAKRGALQTWRLLWHSDSNLGLIAPKQVAINAPWGSGDP